VEDDEGYGTKGFRWGGLGEVVVGRKRGLKKEWKGNRALETGVMIDGQLDANYELRPATVQPL